jgi:type IV pilus assembly protein PilN
VIGGIIVFNMTMDSKIAFLEEQVSAKQQELKKLQKVNSEVNRFKDQMKEIQQKIEIVKTLKEGQKGYYKILTNIEQSMPEDVWLSSINYKGGRIVMNCSSLRVSSVNSFIVNLYETKMFTNIDLEKADKKEDEAVEINNFIINVGVRLD